MKQRFFHAGAITNTNVLMNVQRAVNRRYGPSRNVEEFVRKAQLSHYENTRAQFEDFAASGWANHKMTLYWMLNSHWPSFYGHIIDYYLSPGGAYYGAKKGLRPVSVVFDSYATGDHSQAKIVVFNQSPADVQGLRVRVRVYDLNGKVLYDRSADSVQVPFNGTTQVMALPRYPQSTPVFFVRCQLSDSAETLLSENTYWQSQKDDDMGDRKNDSAFDLKQDSWADMTALNTMAPVQLELSVHQSTTESGTKVAIRLHNPSEHIAFFERATVSATEKSDEILPIRYDDNYITVYPGETAEIDATLSKSAEPRWVRLEGYNTPASSAQIE
jgi:exo-1,4-beta-D-glucosaminidase